jgi:hypothetical protein
VTLDEAFEDVAVTVGIVFGLDAEESDGLGACDLGEMGDLGAGGGCGHLRLVMFEEFGPGDRASMELAEEVRSGGQIAAPSVMGTWEQGGFPDASGPVSGDEDAGTVGGIGDRKSVV